MRQNIRDNSDALYKIERALSYINSHLESRLTLGDLAAHCGFNRTYFSTLFSKLNGLTPWEYIILRRMDRSRLLLRSTNLPIIEIADHCGYENLSNFNRMFARTSGMSPSAYRKRYQKDPDEK